MIMMYLKFLTFLIFHFLKHRKKILGYQIKFLDPTGNHVTERIQILYNTVLLMNIFTNLNGNSYYLFAFTHYLKILKYSFI